MLIELIIIFVVTFFVRIISVTVGGGGLVLLPMLIFFGLSPSQAIATNRFGALSHNFSLIKFHQHNLVKWKLGLFLLIPTLIGTILGTIMVINIDQELFKKLIGLIIIISLILISYKEKIGIKEIKLTKPRLIIGFFLAILAGFLGGLFALTGLWFTYLYIFLGLTFLQSAATRKISALAVGLISVIILIYAGLVEWPVAVTMFVATGLGAWLGAILGIKFGNIWIKRIFILVVIASALKILLF